MENNNVIENKQNPKVSVIVPVYKVEKVLERCVDSLIQQSLKEIEIILVDDESPDGSGKICDEYADKDNRIRVIHKKNGGVSSARNAGLEIATGEYIGFVDSDDYVSTEMYKKLYEKANEFDLDVVNCDYVKNEDEYIGKTNMDKNRVYDKEEIDKLLINANTSEILWYVWRNIYRHELINKQNMCFVEGNVVEDGIFNLEILLNINSIMSIDQALYYYMDNPDGITQSDSSRKQYLERASNEYEEKMKIYDQFNRPELKQDLYAHTLISSVPPLISHLASMKLDRKSAIEKLKEIRETKMISESFDNNKNKINSSYKKKVIIDLLKSKQYSLISRLMKLKS